MNRILTNQSCRCVTPISNFLPCDFAGGLDPRQFSLRTPVDPAPFFLIAMERLQWYPGPPFDLQDLDPYPFAGRLFYTSSGERIVGKRLDLKNVVLRGIWCSRILVCISVPCLRILSAFFPRESTSPRTIIRTSTTNIMIMIQAQITLGKSKYARIPLYFVTPHGYVRCHAWIPSYALAVLSTRNDASFSTTAQLRAPSASSFTSAYRQLIDDGLVPFLVSISTCFAHVRGED